MNERTGGVTSIIEVAALTETGSAKTVILTWTRSGVPALVDDCIAPVMLFMTIWLYEIKIDRAWRRVDFRERLC